MVIGPSEEVNGRLNSKELQMYEILVNRIDEGIDCTKDTMEIHLPYIDDVTKNITFNIRLPNFRTKGM